MITYKQKKDVVFQEIDSEIKILDENQDAIISLNETASVLWDELKKEKTINELIDVILDKFQVSQAEAKLDTENFLKILEEHQLIDVKN